MTWMRRVGPDRDDGILLEDELPLLKGFRGHQPKALARNLGDHYGDAVLSVAGPVLPLTLLATVGDGVTSGTFGQLLLPRHSLVTLVTTLSVSHGLWHGCGNEVN